MHARRCRCRAKVICHHGRQQRKSPVSTCTTDSAYLCNRCESKWGFRSDKQPQPTQQRTMKRRVVVCLRGTRGEITYGKGDASTPKGWCRRRQRALLTSRSGRSQWEWMPGLSVKPRKSWRIYWAKLTEIVSLHLEIGAANEQRGSWCPEAIG